MDLTRAMGLALMLAAVPATLGAQSPAGQRTSVLFQLAESVSTQDSMAQADFAAIALDAMIDAYERELETVGVPRQRRSDRERRKQRRWARAAQGLLEQLYDARYAIDGGARVEVVASAPGEVQVLVDDRLLPVASPRIATPEAFENAVVSEFCDLYPCDEGVTASVQQVATRQRAGGWSVRQDYGSTYVTTDGLGFMFDSVRDRALKEEVCQRAAAELRAVLAVLKQAQALGIRINWQGLRVGTGRRAVDERLVVGFNGQGSQVSMPILLRAPGVLQVAQPWLRARISDRDAQQWFPRADLLFANLLGR